VGRGSGITTTRSQGARRYTQPRHFQRRHAADLSDVAFAVSGLQPPRIAQSEPLGLGVTAEIWHLRWIESCKVGHQGSRLGSAETEHYQRHHAPAALRTFRGHFGASPHQPHPRLSSWRSRSTSCIRSKTTRSIGPSKCISARRSRIRHSQ
jgi:hypothetical protein